MKTLQSTIKDLIDSYGIHPVLEALINDINKRARGWRRLEFRHSYLSKLGENLSKTLKIFDNRYIPSGWNL